MTYVTFDLDPVTFDLDPMTFDHKVTCQTHYVRSLKIRFVDFVTLTFDL